MQYALLSLLVGSASAFSVGTAGQMRSSMARASSVAMSGGSGPNPQDKKTKIPTKSEWVTFANAGDCKPGTVVSGFKFGQEIAIVTTPNGKLYALSNRLPPIGQPATTGGVFDDVIVEPITATAFSLQTGKPKGPWCPSPIGKLVFSWIVPQTDAIVFPVRKSGNVVQVRIDVNAKAKFEQKYWRGVLDSQGKVDGGYY